MNRPRRLSAALSAARREWQSVRSASSSSADYKSAETSEWRAAAADYKSAETGAYISGNCVSKNYVSGDLKSLANANTNANTANTNTHVSINVPDVRGRMPEAPLTELRRKQYKRFLKTYSPDIQNVFADASPEELYNLDRNPTLEALTGWFGRGPTLTWIELQLTRFNDFCGASEKMQAMQIEDLAHLLLANHPGITICQLANFFARMKSGCYSQFYKSVDPMKIASSMRTYMEEQSAAWQRLREREEQARKERLEAESRSRCITYEQYLELKRQGKV